MAYEDDTYRNEDGEPLMDYDDLQSDGEPPLLQPQLDHFLDENLEDDVEEESGGENDNWRDRERLAEGKPRKRLVKKGDAGDDPEEGNSRRANDFVEDDVEGFVGGSSEETGMKRKKEREGSSGRKEKRGFSSSGGKGGSSRRGENRMKSGSSKNRAMMGRRNDGEVKEMWDTIAGGDSEDDQDGVRTVDDDNFIDDSGVDPAERYYSDDEISSTECNRVVRLTIRLSFDVSPATLTYTRRDDMGEYYCDLCKKRRDGRLGVFVRGYCKMEQPWEFHIEGVLPELRKVFAKEDNTIAMERLADDVLRREEQVRVTERKLDEMKRELDERRKKHSSMRLE